MKSKPLRLSSWKRTSLPWWKIRLGNADEIGRGMYGSPDLRLWFLAVSRVGGWGHACFEAGEVVSLLMKVNRTSGEVATYSERALRGFIRDLVDAGLLAPPSNAKCLVIPAEILDSHKNKSRVTCPEHRCRHVWSNRLGGWVATRPDGSFDLEEFEAHLGTTAA